MIRFPQSAVLLSVLILGASPVDSRLEMSVSASMESIRAWLQAHAEPLLDQLNPPASAEQIRAFETDLSIILPEPVREAYALHDGERSSSLGLFAGWRWLPLTEVAERREQLLESGLELARRAIPILESGGGDYLFVESDTDESPVIEWWHGDPARDIRYPSFAGFLGEFVERLEQGQFVYLPGEFAGLVDRDDL